MNKEEKVRNLITNAMGEVSMCWDPIPQGMFQSVLAERIIERLMIDINNVLELDS